MEITSVDILLYYIVTVIENNIEPIQYRRNGGLEPDWEILIGESWESLNHNYEELEKVFIEWQKKQYQINQM